MSATELLEKMEHAAHASGGGHGHGGGPGRGIGITMAMLGVMLAFCAAMVGSARTDLIRTTIQQSNQWGMYQAESTKYRVMEAELVLLHALTPSKVELNQFNRALAAVHAKSGRGDDEDTAELKDALHVSTTELAAVLTPDPEDESRLAGLAKKYARDRAEAKEDAEAQALTIAAHHEEAELYERAQLCAEVGIVIASIALLLSSRAVWAVSIVIGLTGAGIVGYTTVHTSSELREAEEQVKKAEANEASISKDDDAEPSDPGATSEHEPPPSGPTHPPGE